MKDFIVYRSNPNDEFNNLVAESKSSGNLNSILTWGYNNQNYILNWGHIKDLGNDDDYYYELYNLDGNKSTNADDTTRVCCVRYSKFEKIDRYDKTNIYMHDMLLSDYKSIFGNNLKDSRIYSWHSNDYCTNFYWHEYTEIIYNTWQISDDIPYYYTFPTFYKFTEYPTSLWHQNSDLPYQIEFPELIKFTEYPISLWVSNNDLPYQIEFPELIKTKSIYPYALWIIDDDIPYRSFYPTLIKLTDRYPPTPLKTIPIVNKKILCDIVNYKIQINVINHKIKINV